MSDSQFDWDEANIGHIALHGITTLEAEQCILDERAMLMEIQEVAKSGSN